MRHDWSFAPEWKTVPLQCPKCSADLQAKFNPDNRTLEALRCKVCPWTQDCTHAAKHRTARLNAIRRKNPRSIDLQQTLDIKGDPRHGL